MTVSYTLDVSSIKSWAFLRLIFRWRGSIWKSVYFEVTTWLFFYYLVLVFYRFWLGEENQKIFAYFAQQCDKKLEWIPLTFMLGFFVSIVISRWQSIFSHIGFIDDAALFLTTYMPGDDCKMRMVRRNIMRYLCLAQVLVLRDVSVPIRKRFPTIESIQEAGYLNKNERNMFEEIDTRFSKYYVPINWVFSLVAEQRSKEKIKSDLFFNIILQEVRLFRNNLQALVNYDWVPVPLAYPQVVYLAVRVYFAICIVSRQHIADEPHVIGDNKMYLLDTYFPFMTILQLLFYFGWLKVAEVLLNPLGEDDEDLETNFIIDRNLAIAMQVVDDIHGDYPYQEKDSFDKHQMPHCESGNGNIQGLVGSASQLVLNEHDDEHAVLSRKSSVAGMLKNLQRRMSRAPSISISPESPPQHKHIHDSWAGRRPTLYVSEPTNMPTIRSIDEAMEQDNEYSKTSTISFDSKGEEKDKTNKE